PSRIALAELGIGALLGTGGEHHLARRRRVEREIGQRQQQQREQQERTGGDEQVADGEQGMAQDFGHGCGGGVSAHDTRSAGALSFSACYGSERCDSSWSKTTA